MTATNAHTNTMHETLPEAFLSELAPSVERKVASADVKEALGSAAVRSAIAEQTAAEQSYEVTVEPASAEAHLMPYEIARRLETDHVVKSAPDFYTQAQDDDRVNVIYRVGSQRRGLGTHTSLPRFAQNLVAETEHDVLSGLQEYLQTAATATSVLSEDQRGRALGMLETLTFVGKKEYEEAATGIADYWKQQLAENPKLQILAITGDVGDRYAQYDGPREIKSDEYLLDSILDNFSDEECQAFAGRLITDAAQISVEDARDLKAVMLDDWTVSGTQLSDVRDAFAAEHPQFASSLEVQLITANRERITQGLAYRDEDRLKEDQPPTPVRAYYLAHHSTWAIDSGAHVTGAHATVDYDAEEMWEDITQAANRAGDALHPGLAVLKEMPAAANIVRPYRRHGAKLTNAHRLAMHSLAA